MPVPPEWWERQLEPLTQLPERVVARRVQRLDPRRVGRDAGQQHAGEAVILCPLHIGECVVEIVEQDLRETRAPGRSLLAELDEPSVVSVETRPSADVFVRRRRRSDHRSSGEERRDRVREEHLGNHTVGVELTDATFAVPVARPTVVLEVAERVAVARPPLVELRTPRFVEVLAVLIRATAGMAVGRDDRVPVYLHRV